MASTAELSESWSRMDLSELQAIHTIAASPQMAAVCQRMAAFLGNSLNSEADYREDFKSKRPQVPSFDDWSDIEVSDGYSAALMIERAADGGTGRLQEWAVLLRRCICNEMASRLQVRHVMTEGLGRCEN